MKTTVFVIIALSILLTGCSKTIDKEQLQERKGVLYEVNNQAPYTGLVTGFYENGQKESEGNYVDGIWQGKAFKWSEDGATKLVLTFIDGVLM